MTSADEPEYSALVTCAGSSPFTHTLAYRNILRESDMGDACYFVARRKGELRAALPAFVKRTAMGAVMNSLPLVQSAGGVIVTARTAAEEHAALSSALMAAALDYGRANQINVCVFIATPFAIDPSSASADFVINRLTHILDLTQPLQLHHAAREGVRKANRVLPSHHVAEREADAKMVWNLYADSMASMNVPARPWAFYQRLYNCGEAGVRFVWAAINDEPTSAFVLLGHKDVIDYHSVGNTLLGRTHQTNSWLCLQELKSAQSRGVQWWNWGASPTAAVADFKRHFGGQDQTYGISGYLTGDVSAWQQLSPPDLAATFPNFFVLPYSWLRPAKDVAHS